MRSSIRILGDEKADHILPNNIRSLIKCAMQWQMTAYYDFDCFWIFLIHKLNNLEGALFCTNTMEGQVAGCSISNTFLDKSWTFVQKLADFIYCLWVNWMLPFSIRLVGSNRIISKYFSHAGLLLLWPTSPQFEHRTCFPIGHWTLYCCVQVLYQRLET